MLDPLHPLLYIIHMSKTKQSTVGHYEILFIVPNKFTEDEAKQVIAKVEETITKGGGQISHREYWGKKKLAYEIKHNAYGYYSLAEFDMEKTAVITTDQLLKLSTDILRHQIVIKKSKSEKELAREKAIRTKIDAKKAEVAKELKDKEEVEAKEEVAAAKPKKTGKSNLKELDEKLEGILSANDLI